MSARQALLSLRKDRELRREDMARAVGVSQSYYDKVETGILKPSRAFLEKLKTAFPSIDMNVFFVGGTENVGRKNS